MYPKEIATNCLIVISGTIRQTEQNIKSWTKTEHRKVKKSDVKKSTQINRKSISVALICFVSDSINISFLRYFFCYLCNSLHLSKTVFETLTT